MMHKPSWFNDDKVLVANARTCGINKDGLELFKVDPASGQRTDIPDNELADLTDLAVAGKTNGQSLVYIDFAEMSSKRAFVPTYYDKTTVSLINNFIKKHSAEFEAKTIKELIESDLLEVRNGHGSPSSDQRVGDIPYIKVSDLRAGQLNINPTNRIPKQLAEAFWKGDNSGLRPFDLISPERASKNIGEFCVLMPGQENIVITKEVIIFRSKNSSVSQFYLMWALSLFAVRRQWERIVFMQTNREDIGKRYYEIILPYPKSAAIAKKYSKPFETYFSTLDKAKQDLRTSLDAQGMPFHLFFA